MKHLLRLYALATLLLCVAGCALPSAEHRAADRAMFDAVAPRYTAYLEADKALSAKDRERYLRTVRVWDAQTATPTAQSGGQP